MCNVCVCVLGVCVCHCMQTRLHDMPPPLRRPSRTLQSDTSKRCQVHYFLPSFVPSFPPSFICLPLFLRSFFFRSTIFLSLMSVLPPSFTIALSFLPSVLPTFFKYFTRTCRYGAPGYPLSGPFYSTAFAFTGYLHIKHLRLYPVITDQ